MPPKGEVGSLQRQLAAARENLRLVQERKSEYVVSTSIPLELVRDERALEQQIADLEARSAQLQTGVFPHIDDPLPLIELGPEGTIRERTYYLLERLKEARPDESALERLYQDASDFYGQQATAIALLYLADTKAQCKSLEEAIHLAERARKVVDKHIQMVASLLLARFKRQSQSLNDAEQEYVTAVELCEKLKSETEDAIYDQVAEEIQQVLTNVGRASADRIINRCFLKFIPILRPSDRPDMMLGSSEVMEYLQAGVFVAKGNRYCLYQLTETGQRTLELQRGAVYFALPVQDDWHIDGSELGDYALVRQENQISQEGPAICWTEKDLIVGSFKRDPTTRKIHFEPVQARIIGMGSVIAVFKPEPFTLRTRRG